MNNNALVVLSGGLDSAVCAYYACKHYHQVVALSFKYGQRHNIEMKYAKRICNNLGIHREELEINLWKPSSSKLLDITSKIDEGSYKEVLEKKMAEGQTPISDEYVPNRNAIFTNIAAAWGMQCYRNKPFDLIIGIHADDAASVDGKHAAYPDCTEAWYKATAESLYEGTAGIVNLAAPLVGLNKSGVVELGLQNSMPPEVMLNDTWSCYQGGKKQCGHCPTCVDKIHSFINNKVLTTPDEVMQFFALTKEDAEKYFNN